MSESNVSKVSTWLKSIGATLIVVSGSFAATASDGGFGDSAGSRRAVYALAGAIAGIGWMMFLTGLSWHPETTIWWRTALIWLTAAGVVGSSGLAFFYRLGELNVPFVVNIVYVVSWILLATVFAVSRKGAAVEMDGVNLIMGMGAVTLICVATLLVHPWERGSCLTEGPAQVMVMGGWILLSLTR